MHDMSMTVMIDYDELMVIHVMMIINVMID